MVYLLMKGYCKLILLAYTSFYTLFQNRMISACSWSPLPYLLHLCVHAFTEAGSVEGITGTLMSFWEQRIEYHHPSDAVATS